MRSFRIVDLPAPLGPMIPKASPAATWNETSRTAQNSSSASSGTDATPEDTSDQCRHEVSQAVVTLASSKPLPYAIECHSRLAHRVPSANVGEQMEVTQPLQDPTPAATRTPQGRKN